MVAGRFVPSDWSDASGDGAGPVSLPRFRNAEVGKMPEGRWTLYSRMFWSASKPNPSIVRSARSRWMKESE